MSKLLAGVPTWDPRLIVACAKLSDWVYTKDDPKSEPLPDVFMKLYDVPYDVKKGQLTAFASVFAPEIKTLFVVHRGTTEGTDVLADAGLIPHPLHNTGIKVHSGIYALAANDIDTFVQRLRDRLDELDDDVSVCFTGHSLGGAIARLMLLEFELARRDLSPRGSLGIGDRVARVVTFGAPMVLHTVPDDLLELVQSVGMQSLNFIKGNDAVPRLPGLCRFVEKNGISAFGFLRSPPQWFRNYFSWAHEASQQLFLLAEQYTHFGQLARISHYNVVDLIDQQRLMIFSQDDENVVQYSIFKDHAMSSYLHAISDASQYLRESADEAHIVARLEFIDKGWFSSRFVHEFQLVPNSYGISNIRDGIVDEAATAKVVSFCGNSRAGKSFIIQKLQALGGDKALPGPFVCEHDDDGATSCDVSLWQWAGGWLLDCEGTCGSALPRTASKTYRDIEKGLRPHVGSVKREDMVKKFFPPLCVSVSSVFCYVTLDSYNNTSAYTAVCDFAASGWDDVASAVRPGLVIIQNQVEASRLVDPAVVTSQFLMHDREGRLTSLFLDVRVVQVPCVTDDNADFLVKSKNKTVQKLFDERLDLLQKTLLEFTRRHLENMASSKLVLTEVTWLRLLPRVCELFWQNKPVNIAEIVPTLVERPQNFFEDVVRAARLLLSTEFLTYRDRKELEEKVLDVIQAVMEHAAVLMAQVAASVGAVCCPKWLQTVLGDEWSKALLSVTAMLPCLAVSSDLLFPPPHNVCGQPSLGHDCHKARICRRWAIIRPRGRAFWEGPHELSQEVHALLQAIEIQVFDRAVEVMSLFVAKRKLDHRRSARERLPAWVQSSFSTVHRRSALLSSCYVCGMIFEESSFYELVFFWPQRVFFRSQRVEVCAQCGTSATFSRSSHELLDAGHVE